MVPEEPGDEVSVMFAGDGAGRGTLEAGAVAAVAVWAKQNFVTACRKISPNIRLKRRTRDMGKPLTGRGHRGNPARKSDSHMERRWAQHEMEWREKADSS